jgi:hypothetical protein
MSKLWWSGRPTWNPCATIGDTATIAVTARRYGRQSTADHQAKNKIIPAPRRGDIHAPANSRGLSEKTPKIRDKPRIKASSGIVV